MRGLEIPGKIPQEIFAEGRTGLASSHFTSRRVEQLVYCGVDIAKSYLDAAIANEKRRLANDPVGHREFIKWIKQIEGEVQVICEPSGGYERPFIHALVRAQIKVSLVQPIGCEPLLEPRAFWPRPIAQQSRERTRKPRCTGSWEQPRATDIRNGTETPSRGSLQPVCSAALGWL